MKHKPNELPPYEPEGVKIAEKILKILLFGLAVPAFFLSPFGLYNLVRGSLAYYFHKSDFHREIKRLEKKKYIALTKTPDGWMIRLLKKGERYKKQIEAKDKIENIRLPTNQAWDGKWRLFVFDIPEEKRYVRDLLRDKLKELGLYNAQRSVFVYPYDCRNELAFISNYFNLYKYTTYAQADYIDIDRELRHHFKKIIRK
ncbi:MAG: hypothetical protein HY396_02280 [Candidatus Doudnabacteria bacterium]|nr:hypothetical protein [Candidatus Doudnabacteria bacterium]